MTIATAIARATGGFWLLLSCPDCGKELALSIGAAAARCAGGIRAWTGREVRCVCGEKATLEVRTPPPRAQR